MLWLLLQQGGPPGQGFIQALGATVALAAWMVLDKCWQATPASFSSGYQHREQLSISTAVANLAANDTWQLELLAGKTFRYQYCALNESGLSGTELILRKDPRRTLAQCRQCKRQQVSVSIVRETYSSYISTLMRFETVCT